MKCDAVPEYEHRWYYGDMSTPLPPVPATTSRKRKPALHVSASHSVTPDAAVPAPLEGRDDHLLGSIEAVLLSIDRPVSALRLADAMGLINESTPGQDLAEESDEAGEGGRGVVTASGPQKKVTPLGVVCAGVALLNQEYASSGRAFRIEAVAGGYRMMSLPRFAGVIESFLGKRERTSLSRPAVETLAIVAYKQPITRAALESVRGVACGEVLKTLIDRRLVAITGRADELGRPMLYGTTRPFLEAFGLSSLKDLPSVEEFKSRHAGGEDEAS